jgi:hypothetical protein
LQHLGYPSSLSGSWIQWDIRNPDGGATGLEFARARTAPLDQILVHAAPSRVAVEVRDSDGKVLASVLDLEAAGATPISRLKVEGTTLTRENIWPGPDDLGSVVVLPGGEAGTLERWWHADDHSEWRWTLELRNHV